MIAHYQEPPYQPKWILQLQVFLLRHLRSSFNKETMVINTTGRKTGKKYAVPIGYIPDGETYLAINLGAQSNWYLNAIADPHVTLEIEGKKFAVRAEPISTDSVEAIREVMSVIDRVRPNVYERFFGLTYKPQSLSDEDLLRIQKQVAFMRFWPLA